MQARFIPKTSATVATLAFFFAFAAPAAEGKQYCDIFSVGQSGKSVKVTGKVTESTWETHSDDVARYAVEANVEGVEAHPCVLTVYSKQKPKGCSVGASLKAVGRTKVIILFLPPVPMSVLTPAKITCGT